MFTLDQLLNEQTYPDFSSLDSSYDTANPLIQNLASTSKNIHVFLLLMLVWNLIF